MALNAEEGLLGSAPPRFRLKPPQDRAARQRQGLVHLTRPGGRGLETALGEVTRVSADTLEVERVSVWLLEEDGAALRRRAAHAPTADAGPERLATVDHPDYFRAARDNEIVTAHEARMDPRTRGLPHLEALGISSILDAPVRVGGKLRAVVRHEHVGAPRWWTDDEETFAVAVAAIVALAIGQEERFSAEQALREAEERLRQLAENIQEVFWLRDVKSGRDVYVSRAFEAIWGRSPDALLKNPELWAESLHPEDKERVLAGSRRRIPYDGETIEYRIVRPDGQIRWIRDRAFPVRDASGDVYRVAGVAEDVTERKRADEALRFQKSLLEAQTEAAQDGILVLSLEGSIISHNRRFARLWGVPEDILRAGSERETMGFILGRLAHPKDFLARCRYLSDHPDDISSEEITLADGRVFDHYSAPVKAPGKKFYGRVWFFRDVTSRKRLESQLRQGQKMEAIGRLAGGVAHDFNNLLTGIIGYCDVLSSKMSERPEVVADLLEIRQAGQRAASLTGQLLAFSRKQTLQPKLLDLNEAVGNLEKMLRRLIGEDVELKTELASDIGGVRADAGQMDQVLINLAVNARDAMPGGGQLTISTRNVDVSEAFADAHPGAAPGAHVLLRVQDTGVGMSKETLAHLFEPFFTTKEQGKGTGLGLATVYGIVSQSRGWVDVRSTPGAGTSFDIYLPKVGERPAKAVPAPPPAATSPGKGRVFLVEDEVIVRRLVNATLTRQGYSVREATNGAEALELLNGSAEGFDILLTDLIMPRMGGRELAQRLRSLRPELPVLYMSGYSNDEAFREGVVEPGASLISKPFAPAELLKVLGTVLEGRDKPK